MSKIIYTLLIVISVIFTACSDSDKNRDINNATTNDISKDTKKKDDGIITLKDVEGNSIKVIKTQKGFQFPDFKDRVVLINFFATWCPPCKAEIPHLNNLQEKYKNNLVIIGVLLEENKDNDEIKNFINYHSINYTISNAEGNFQLAKAVGGVQSIPFMIMYDKNGDYVTHYLGAIPEEMIDADIQRVIK